MSLSAFTERIRRIDPRWLDGAFAALLSVLSLLGLWLAPEGAYPGRYDVITNVLLVAMAAPLAFRRRHPLVVLTLVGWATILYAITGPANGFGLGVLVALYSTAVYADRQASQLGLFWTFVGIVVSYAASLVNAPGVAPIGFVGDLVITLLTFFVAWFLGDLVRMREQALRDLRERNHELEAEREENARLAVEGERARIARELHDAVAHNVSVMVVQAAAARRTLETGRETTEGATTDGDAREALATIEATGRDTLAEMRRVVGALRPTAGAAYEPAPSLARLDGLLDAIRRSGLEVDLVVEGDPRPLPQGIDLSAYRVVQEALTNTLKHAAARAAHVRLRYGAEVLEVEVTDDGRGAAARLLEPPHHGYGLVGMRERVAMLGGELRAEPLRGGGFEVSARLPLGTPA